MKKVLHILIVLITIATSSCSNPETRKKHTSEVIPVRRMMWQPLYDNLVMKYPNVLHNELVRENATKELVALVDSLVPLHYLEDIPLRVHKVGMNPHGKGTLAQFYADNYNKNDYTNMLQFDIVGFMNEEMAVTIDDAKKYYVYAHNYKRLNTTEANIMLKSMYYSPKPAISKGVITEDMEVNIGMFLCEIDSIKVVPEY